jgi:hypothetical protein
MVHCCPKYDPKAGFSIPWNVRLVVLVMELTNFVVTNIPTYFLVLLVPKLLDKSSPFDDKSSPLDNDYMEGDPRMEDCECSWKTSFLLEATIQKYERRPLRSFPIISSLDYR